LTLRYAKMNKYLKAKLSVLMPGLKILNSPFMLNLSPLANVIFRVVNSRQTIFFNFDRTRSLSLDVHESCNFKPKKRNLNSPKNAYFTIFRLFCNFSPILTYFRKNDEFSPISFSNLLAERIFYKKSSMLSLFLSGKL